MQSKISDRVLIRFKLMLVSCRISFRIHHSKSPKSNAAICRYMLCPCLHGAMPKLITSNVCERYAYVMHTSILEFLGLISLHTLVKISSSLSEVLPEHLEDLEPRMIDRTRVMVSQPYGLCHICKLVYSAVLYVGGVVWRVAPHGPSLRRKARLRSTESITRVFLCATGRQDEGEGGLSCNDAHGEVHVGVSLSRQVGKYGRMALWSIELWDAGLS